MMSCMCAIGVRRGNIGRNDLGDWSRSCYVASGRVLVMMVMSGKHDRALLSGGMEYPVASSSVRVHMYPYMPRQLIGTAEFFGAACMNTCVRLLSGVSSDMPRLVLQAMEGLGAHGTLVRSRHVWA